MVFFVCVLGVGVGWTTITIGGVGGQSLGAFKSQRVREKSIPLTLR